MNSSPQNTSSLSDEFEAYVLEDQEEDGGEAESHVHLPNPSYWPLVLGIAVVFSMIGVLFISSFPWITVIAAVFVLVGILGWGLEDPNAHIEHAYVALPEEELNAKYQLGQDVVDANGQWLGTVQARFSRYILVERGRLRARVYYVPQNLIKSQSKGDTLFLTVSEGDLLLMAANQVPEDLYLESPELGVPKVRGVAQFARRPLSPAETGHYNYGRLSPGINTDAAGSYHREEVQQRPQSYVTEGFYATDAIPARVTSPD